MTSTSLSAWRAHPACPEHLRFILEKTVNTFPPAWIDVPVTGEVFSSIDECRRRLIGYALSQGFDIVITHSTKSPTISTTFSCTHHGKETRNTRKLPSAVERNKEGVIIGTRQRELTSVKQTECPWACKVSFKSIGKRGSEKGFLLTVKNITHGNTHALATNPLVYQAHRDRVEEYQVLKAQARSHRVSVLSYTLSRQVLDAVDSSGLNLTRREYYNLKKFENFNEKDDRTIDGLLYALDGANFIHKCRLEYGYDEAGKVVSRKLIQIWFSHITLLKASAKYVAGSVCIIDATFNTNKVRMPIIVAAGVLSNSKTFPIAFSYCRAEDHTSYAFFWESLKEYWPVGTTPPAVVISDQAGAILSSLQEQFPGVIHQICEWHAVEAMCAKFRHSHTLLDIQGWTDVNNNITLGLKDLAWVYVKSETKEDLETNRQTLVDALKQGGKDYIEGVWRPKEDRVIRYFTLLHFNLGCHSSQRVESYHNVLKEMTNGQLSLVQSAQTLVRTVLNRINEMKAEQDNDLKAYSRFAQSPVFLHLRLNITNHALTKIAKEWDTLCQLAPENPPTINAACECVLLYQFGLPCHHHLYQYYLTGAPIPRSLCHPRWWINGGPIIVRGWAPFSNRLPNPDFQPQLFYSSAERRLLELREGLDRQGRQQLERRRARRQELVDEEMVEIAARQLQHQSIPIQQPEPVIKRKWIQAKTHGRADARGLTANEQGERRQRQEARQEANEVRIAQAQFIQQSKQAAADDTQLSTITVAPGPMRTPSPPPSSQLSHTSILSIRTPATPERPRPRRTPTPEASPLAISAFEAPASTAPPKLGREKRKRPHTKKYQEAKAQGDIAESQEAHKAKWRG